MPAVVMDTLEAHVRQRRNLEKQCQALLLEMQQQAQTLITQLKVTNPEVDAELLARMVDFHLRKWEESTTVLCTLLRAYSTGQLDSKVILALAQWT